MHQGAKVRRLGSQIVEVVRQELRKANQGSHAASFACRCFLQHPPLARGVLPTLTLTELMVHHGA